MHEIRAKVDCECYAENGDQYARYGNMNHGHTDEEDEEDEEDGAAVFVVQGCCDGWCSICKARAARRCVNCTEVPVQRQEVAGDVTWFKPDCLHHQQGSSIEGVGEGIYGN